MDEQQGATLPVTLFYSYAHEDETLRNELEKHLSTMKRQGIITSWHDQRIQAGIERSQAIDDHLNAALVILLLISPDFLASDYCYGTEMQRAMERHNAKEAVVIPVILRHVDWHDTPFSKLQVLPPDGKPIKAWNDRDQAFLAVARGIRTAIGQLHLTSTSTMVTVQQANQGITTPQAILQDVSPPADTLPPNHIPLTRTQTQRGRRWPFGITKIPRRTIIATGIAGAIVFLAGGGIAVISQQKKQGLRYFYHLSPNINVNNVAWSPDGNYLASANGDGTAWVMGAINYDHLVTYTHHSKFVNDVAWSPDSQRVASASGDGTVQIWIGTTGGYLLTYRGHSESVWTVAWSPDNHRIASGGHDKTAQIWDASSGTTLYTCRGHIAGVWRVAWSPDGNHIASASDDGTVRVWDASKGTPIYTYHGHSGPVYDTAWSPDGKCIVSASKDNTVQVWNANDGSVIYTYKGHKSSVQAAQWSPNGKFIASGSQDKTVQIWDATKGNVVYIYSGHSSAVYGVVWSPDGGNIASAGDDGTIQVWTPGVSG